MNKRATSGGDISGRGGGPSAGGLVAALAGRRPARRGPGRVAIGISERVRFRLYQGDARAAVTAWKIGASRPNTWAAWRAPASTTATLSTNRASGPSCRCWTRSRARSARQLAGLRLIAEETRGEVPFIQTIFNPLSVAKYLVGEERLRVHLRRYTRRATRRAWRSSPRARCALSAR